MCNADVPDILKLNADTIDTLIQKASDDVVSEVKRLDILRSLTQAEFDALPRLSPEDIQRSLDAGRPEPLPGGGWNPRW